MFRTLRFPRSVRRLASVAALTFVAACGGATPSPVSPTAAPPPAPVGAPESSPVAPPLDEAAKGSVVRFDDLGISVTIPPGLRAVGDDELATRVRASASPKVRDLIRARVAQKRALPLLTLAKDADAAHADAWLTVTLSVVAVPVDATAPELMDQQRATMTKHLDAYEVTQASSPISVDGLAGASLAGHHDVKRGADVVRVASESRVFIRDGLAYLIVAIWSELEAASAGQARAALDAVHFYAPQP